MGNIDILMGFFLGLGRHLWVGSCKLMEQGICFLMGARVFLSFVYGLSVLCLCYCFLFMFLLFIEENPHFGFR